MWDAHADGYARGEGFAAIVLKPLRQAIADGDDIECVIRETGVNQVCFFAQDHLRVLSSFQVSREGGGV